MANQDLTQLSQITTIQSGDLYYVVRGTTNFAITGASLIAGVVGSFGSGTNGQVLTLVAGLPVWQNSGGGGGVPDLPIWEYAESLADGMFTTDHDEIAQTTLISLAINSKNGGNAIDPLQYIASSPLSSWLILSDSSGANWTFRVSAQSVGGFGVDFTVGLTSSVPGSGDWSGEYTVWAIADVTNIHDTMVLADTGWVSNADAGDKAVSVPTIPDLSALDAFSPGFAAWADALDNKFKALQVALVAKLRPDS